MTDYVITIGSVDSAGIYRATLYEDEIPVHTGKGHTQMTAIEAIPVRRWTDEPVSVVRRGEWAGCLVGDELLVETG